MTIKNRKIKMFLLLFFAAIFVNIVSASHIYAENTKKFMETEDSLINIATLIPNLTHDFEKLSLNEKFTDLLYSALEKEGSFYYPFDSLTTVSVLTSPDEVFRIITWYIPLSDGTFDYFGFFQAKDDRRGDIVLYTLQNDYFADYEEKGGVEYLQLSHENWHGTFYYEVIHTRHEREDYYTLLGWRGDNPLTRKRIIEPIRLGERSRPVFGIPLFTYKDNRLRRIVFEYSANVSMYLAYDRQLIRGHRRPTNMIVFDRLEPSHPRLEGHRHFYFPETNIVDAFLFEEGRWVFYEEIDARNPDN